MTAPLSKGRSELRQALLSSRGALTGVAVFSAVVNLLMLTGPLFMLQVYDRVLSSHSSATLLVLFAFVAFLYGLMGFLDHVRGRVLARVGARFQARLDGRVFRAVLKQAEHPGLREQPAGGLRDLSSIQAFLSSPLPGAAFDLPWTPLFLAILFAFNMWMGWLGLAGGIVIGVLAFANQRLTQKSQADAARLARDADAATERTRKQIETVRALGMMGPLVSRWHAVRETALEAQIAASDRGGGGGARGSSRLAVPGKSHSVKRLPVRRARSRTCPCSASGFGTLCTCGRAVRARPRQSPYSAARARPRRKHVVRGHRTLIISSSATS